MPNQKSPKSIKLKEELRKAVFDKNYVNYHNLMHYRLLLQDKTSKIPKLYRYVKPDYRTIRSLETGQLKLMPGSKFNDVFESLPVFDADARTNLKRRGRGKLAAIADNPLIKSFTENKSDLLMWSHYADGGKGFLIEFDITMLDEDSAWILEHLYPVVYSHNRVDKIDLESVIDDHFQYRKDSFDRNDYVESEYYEKLHRAKDALVCLTIVKSNYWQMENKWRIAVPILYLELRKQILDGIISFDCVSDVYCGPRMDKSILQHLVDIVNRKKGQGKHLRLYKMKINPTTFGLMADVAK